MFDREDVVFKDALDRIFHQLLYGDGKSRHVAGYYGALRGSQTWEQHLRAIGRIEGLEIAINEMDKLAHRMDIDSMERQAEGRIN
jgi:hypothetical protein